MAQFDKTFPTLDCAACILTPKMTQVGKHKNIRLRAYSEVQEVGGVHRELHGEAAPQGGLRRHGQVHGVRALLGGVSRPGIPGTRVIRKGSLVDRTDGGGGG